MEGLPFFVRMCFVFNAGIFEMFRVRGGRCGLLYTILATHSLKTWGLVQGELQLACKAAMSNMVGGRKTMNGKRLSL